MSTFIVEWYVPGITEAAVAAMTAALVGATDAEVRCLGATLLPTDEVVLFGFEATDVRRVEAIAARVGLTCDRLITAILFDPTG